MRSRVCIELSIWTAETGDIMETRWRVVRKRKKKM